LFSMPAFTTIAASAGLAATAAGTGMSVGQMIKQNRMMAQADAAAAKSLEDARRSLEKNYMASLAVPKLAYDNARRELSSQYSQAMEAGREGEARGLGATVGRVAATATNAQNQIAQAQEKELYDLNLATAAEDTRLRDIGAQLDLTAAEGAQAASAQAAEQKAQSLQSIASGVQSMAGQVGQMIPLFSTKSGRMVDKAFKTATNDYGTTPEQLQKQFTSFLGDEAGSAYREFFPGATDAASGKYNAFTAYSPKTAENMMTPNEFKAALSSLSPDQLNQIFTAFQTSAYYKP
jgi:hypothetical protein